MAIDPTNSLILVSALMLIAFALGYWAAKLNITPAARSEERRYFMKALNYQLTRLPLKTDLAERTVQEAIDHNTDEVHMKAMRATLGAYLAGVADGRAGK